MTKKKRNSRFKSPNPAAQEKRVRYLSSDLRDPKIKEFSEVSSYSTREMQSIRVCSYVELCEYAALAPSVKEWGLLHCTVRDKRGRRARMTLATNDLTYHRAYVAAANYENTEAVELAVMRYPFKRPGWPGPVRQGGSWPLGEAIPWMPTYRDAGPDVSEARHLHGIQATEDGAVREICVIFAKSSTGVEWTMIDDDPTRERSKVVIPEPEVEFYLPAGVAVVPGWPLASEPSPCPITGCD